MDPHVFADLDPDPLSQNLSDPTDPDPKHCLQLHKLVTDLGLNVVFSIFLHLKGL